MFQNTIDRLQPNHIAILQKIGAALDEGSSLEPHLSIFLDDIHLLRPSMFVQASMEIRGLCGLYTFSNKPEGLLSGWRPSRSREYQLHLLCKHPCLSALFLIHGDGRIREAALDSLRKPPKNAFEFLALAYRLNDWVEPVRSSAAKTFERLTCKICPSVVAQSALHLFDRIHSWERWTNEERSLLTSTLYRSDVMQKFSDILLQRPEGHISRIVRQALREPGLDGELSNLLHKAGLPVVRAIALDTLISYRARWIVGHKRDWINKPFGIFRMVPVYESRVITHNEDIEHLIAQGANDKAVSVRKVSAQGLISHCDQSTISMNKVATTLAHDASRAVRERAKFYLSKKNGN